MLHGQLRKRSNRLSHRLHLFVLPLRTIVEPYSICDSASMSAMVFSIICSACWNSLLILLDMSCSSWGVIVIVFMGYYHQFLLYVWLMSSPFFLYWRGLTPKCCLNALEKWDRFWKPHRLAMAVSDRFSLVIKCRA